MTYRRIPLAPNEWFHCYSRGVEKRKVFETTSDYLRFTQMLYLANNVAPVERSSFDRDITHEEILSLPRKELIVAIGAYCLMPSHFHLILKALTEGGITKFMRKLSTGYTMYFNVKRARVGNLFVKPFRSKHISDNIYFKQVVPYVLFNPIELFEPQWKTGSGELKKIENKLFQYQYSSLIDFFGQNRPEGAITGNMLREFYPNPDFTEMLCNAQEFYRTRTPTLV